MTNCGACGKEICAEISPIVFDEHLCSDCYFEKVVIARMPK